MGRAHALSGRNRQDAVFVRDTSFALADGCGSCEQSEVGAMLAVRCCSLLAERLVSDGVPLTSSEFLEQLQKLLLAELEKRVLDLGRDLGLFSLLGACVTEEWTLLYGLGDGAFACNGTVTEIGPFENDAPPYLAYGAPLQLAPLVLLPTTQVHSFALASDGAVDMLRTGVGDCFDHADRLRRKLFLSKPSDDASLIVCARLS